MSISSLEITFVYVSDTIRKISQNEHWEIWTRNVDALNRVMEPCLTESLLCLNSLKAC